MAVGGSTAVVSVNCGETVWKKASKHDVVGFLSSASPGTRANRQAVTEKTRCFLELYSCFTIYDYLYFFSQV